MPEGDSILALARRLDADLRARVLAEARVDGQPIESFRNAAVDEVFAIGKHAFVRVGHGLLRTHLGMHGKWLRVGADEWRRRGPTSAALVFDDVAFLCVRAKEAEFLDARGMRYRRFCADLAIDLTADTCDLEPVVARAREFAAADAPICDVLLNQRIAAGIGNVYKSETLFLGGVSPHRPLADVPDEVLFGLYRVARESLRRNLAPGPRRTRATSGGSVRAARSDDDPGYFVYGRNGEPCSVCQTTIRYARFGRHNRSSYWCPRCQS